MRTYFDFHSVVARLLRKGAVSFSGNSREGCAECEVQRQEFWNGSYYVDEHADGSRTYRWSVRVADFDQIKGHIINAIERLDYRVAYE